MRRHSTRRTRVDATFLSLALLVSACGGSGSSPGAAPPADAGRDDASTPGTPHHGGSRTDAAEEATETSVAKEAGHDVGSTAMDAGATTLGRPSAAIVQDAVAADLSYYHRNASTGDIWCLPCDGAPVMLAVASLTGDTSADARLLQQMRYILQPGNEPFGTGGYAANDDRNATAMYAVAKLVPRVWSQLTSAELHKIDLIMEATLVSDLYATADKTNANGPPRTLDGSNDSNRDFNPNYREGMIGAVLTGTEYFGGEAAVDAMTATFDYVSFTAELKAQGLDNLYWTYGTNQNSPSAGAPSADDVEQGIVGYAMHGITLAQPLDLYVYLAGNTFSAKASCGLNDGAGIVTGGVAAGRIVSGCSGLPNAGAVGEELEFDSVDGNGPRSSSSYARLGVRDDLFNQIVLLAYGDWQTTPASGAILPPLAVGVTDFFYKVAAGYEDYSEGKDQGLFNCATGMDCPLNQAMWTEVLAPAHAM